MSNWNNPDKDEQIKAWIQPKHRAVTATDIAQFLWRYFRGYVLVGVMLWVILVMLCIFLVTSLTVGR